MHLRPARTAATAAAIGGVLVLGLGSAQAAMAYPETYRVPCNADALDYDLTNVANDGTLFLAPGCTYYLPGGLTDTKTSLTIVGDGATLHGGGPDSDFTILTVNSGKALTLDDVNFTGGSQEDGGAIDNSGDLSINGGVFSHNSGEFGGAIDDEDDSLMINGAVFTGNEGGDGGAIFAESSVTTITGAQFSQNKADDGGAIWVEIAATIADSAFTGNTAEYGGAIYNDDTLILKNVTGVAGSGNAFTGNLAYQGGGIYNDDTATIGDSLIAFNAARDVGGGIYNVCDKTFTLPGSTVYGNVTDNIYEEGCK